ncbi:MAG: hypothetical protein J6V25_08370 [Oscillospiraceae bacterium]|nr:hypothetical protein [Oscillospiraceae bacterium]
MKNRKSKALALAIVLIMALFFANRTIAYKTVVGTATNVVTSGNIQLQILETTDNGAFFPKEGVEVIPGQTVKKSVFIKNVCDHPFWLRIQVVVGSGEDELPASEILEILDLNVKYWAYRDGYYYYHRILQPGEITEPLFTQVLVRGDKVNQHDVGKSMSLIVKAYAVQSENNPAASPWEAAGWPEA